MQFWGTKPERLKFIARTWGTSFFYSKTSHRAKSLVQLNQRCQDLLNWGCSRCHQSTRYNLDIVLLSALEGTEIISFLHFVENIEAQGREGTTKKACGKTRLHTWVFWLLNLTQEHGLQSHTGLTLNPMCHFLAVWFQQLTSSFWTSLFHYTKLGGHCPLVGFPLVQTSGTILRTCSGLNKQ